MRWAREHAAVVFTHDLDFGSLLAVTGADGPSVVQIRTQDVSPAHLGPFAVSVLRKQESALESGALIVVHEATTRVRILPLES
jgi:predicted nuclease of predicted toxin-antitoxin system